MRKAAAVFAGLTLLCAGTALDRAALAQTATPGAGAGAGAPAAAPATPSPTNIATAQSLADLCGTPDSDPSYPGKVSLCVGYMSGVLDFYMSDTRARARSRKVCLPSQMPTRGEERADFVNWVQANQQHAAEPAVYGVMRFYISQYPCTHK